MAKPLGVVLNFYADSKSAVRDIRKLNRSLDSVGDRAAATGRSMKKGFAVGAAAVAAGAAGAGYALWGMVEGAIADDAAQRRLAKSLENTTGATDAQVASVEEWITAQGRALGVTDDELRPALARLARSTEDVGKAQELAGIAMDIAATTGKPLATVADALAKAYDGNTGALKRMGIQLDDGPKKWETLAASVDGAAESQAASVEGSMTRIKTALGEAGESVGASLLPAFQEFADWLSSPDGTAAIEDFAAVTEAFGRWVSTDLPAELDAGVEALTGPGSFYENLMQIWDLLTDITNEAYKLTHGGKTAAQVASEKQRRDAADPSTDWLLPKTTPGGTPSGKRVSGGSRTVNVTVVNGKQEKAVDSAAMAIRLAKTVGF